MRAGRFYKRIAAVILLLSLALPAVRPASARRALAGTALAGTTSEDYIRWVDFTIPYETMEKALALDIRAHEEGRAVSWIELLAYLAAKNGNNFCRYRDSQLDDPAAALASGKTMAELTEHLKYYGYYLEAFTAVLGGFVGEYELEVPDGVCGKHWERRYGLKVFSPIAKYFPYSHYDDFGTSRTYGWSRTHQGNDLLGQVGTPVIAVEGGVVEAMGWDQFGGWRVGIRSHDRKRYYYYAHLRKDYPYHSDLAVGSAVKSGDVIGYVGRTGYSIKENVNHIDVAHLHFGLQLIFDESQKDCVSEIWINVYEIVRLLETRRSEVKKDPETGDYYRLFEIRDIAD